MPIREFLASGESHCDYCGNGFELLLKTSDPEPTRCPRCSARVKRIVSAPHVNRQSPSLDSDNVGKHGFTQYRKSATGVYEKTAGKGPEIITDD